MGAHLLTVEELAEHTHDVISGDGGAKSVTRWAIKGQGLDTMNDGYIYNFNATQPSGGGHPHNNMSPYLVVYIFKRTA